MRLAADKLCLAPTLGIAQDSSLRGVWDKRRSQIPRRVGGMGDIDIIG